MPSPHVHRTGRRATRRRVGRWSSSSPPGWPCKAQTPQTEDYLRLLVPPDAGASPVPAAAYNVAAQLLAVEAGVDHRPPWARVHLAGRSWLTLRAARVLDQRPSERQDIAVSIEACDPLERADLFARVHGLTLVGPTCSGDSRPATTPDQRRAGSASPSTRCRTI
jgi:hypothetical protein